MLGIPEVILGGVHTSFASLSDRKAKINSPCFGLEMAKSHILRQTTLDTTAGMRLIDSRNLPFQIVTL